MTALTPPMNSATGFLKMRHDTEAAGTKAASPFGLVRSSAGRPGAARRSAAECSSQPASGQGRLIGDEARDAMLIAPTWGRNRKSERAVTLLPWRGRVGERSEPGWGGVK